MCDDRLNIQSNHIDISYVPSPHSLGNRLIRVLWGIAYCLLYRPSPKPFHGWRRILLRLFGAKIGKGVHPYPSARVWGPWNLEMQEFSCLADHVDCYCVAKVTVGAHSTVSQYSYLCTASHDYLNNQMPMVTAPIQIKDQVWICADVFIAPGVTVAEGAVVGARASVFCDVDPWTVVAGNPAKPIKKRILTTE